MKIKKKVAGLGLSLGLVLGGGGGAMAGEHPNKAIPEDGVWYRLAMCESSNTNWSKGKYRGFFQFDKQAWHGYGVGGDTADRHSYMVQLAAAQKLQEARGWVPWPACSVKLGLRKAHRPVRHRHPVRHHPRRRR